jgi:arsenite-transporting ATPase
VRLVLYTGKGGVGKTTTAAATALCAAERGVRTLVVSTDLAHSLGDVIDCELAPIPVAIAPKLDAVELDPRAEMSRHYGSIRDYLVELFRYQGIEDVVADELALLPGAEEITVLLAVEDIARGGLYDFVVVDCAPTGSTLRLLSLPDLMSGALRVLPNVLRVLSALVSPLARSLVSLPLPHSGFFRDLQRLVDERTRQLRRRLSARDTSVRLVVTPERMVIDEARRAFMELSLFDVGCDAVVMNRLLPEAAGREEFFRPAWDAQQERQREVEECFAPVTVIDAPLQRDEVIGLEALSMHGHEIFRNREPQALLSPTERLRFTRHASGHRLELPLPGASPEQLCVTKVEGELIVRAAARRRAIALPPRIARLAVESARLEDGNLIVSFARPEASGSSRSASSEASES